MIDEPNDYDAALDAGLDDLGDMMPHDIMAGVDDHLAKMSGNLPGPEGMGGDYLKTQKPPRLPHWQRGR